MFLFILAIVALLIGLTAFAFNPRFEGYDGEPDKTFRIPIAVGTLFLVGALITLSCLSFVGAKNIGIVTQFGKPVDTGTAGVLWHAPWEGVTEIDGTVVTNEYYGDDCITGKIGDGSSACLYATIRWRINPDKADTIYGDYRDKDDEPTEEFRKAVISTQFKAAVQNVLGAFNPVSALEVIGEDEAATAQKQLDFVPDVDQMGSDLERLMKDRLAKDNLAEIVSISVSGVQISKSTQKTIDEFIAEVGRTRIAAQNRKTSEQQALANKAISDSVNNNPAVLESRCIDALLTAIEKDYGLPAGFSCFGGNSVVLPAAK